MSTKAMLDSMFDMFPSWTLYLLGSIPCALQGAGVSFRFAPPATAQNFIALRRYN